MATHITNATQLQAINSDLTADYILDNDIDLTGVTWTPIGLAGDGFEGTFDGQNFTIRNLTLAGTASNDPVGLFAVITGQISNLNLSNFVITLDSVFGAGGLVGSLSDEAIITNCHISGITITDSVLSQAIGGLIGIIDTWVLTQTDVTIENCSAEDVAITTSFSHTIGGLIGNKVPSSTDTKGLTINKCFSTGAVISSMNTIANYGGFFGICEDATVTNCYSHVNVTVGNAVFHVSGFFGYMDQCDVSKCYSSGAIVTGTNCYEIGGFIGAFHEDALDPPIHLLNCYSVSSITTGSGNQSTGGFIGFIDHNLSLNSSTIINCSWYTGASTYAIGFYDDTGVNGPVATLSELSWGTDETVNTDFYSKTHVVYDQGNANAWDFASGDMWYEHADRYPDFVGDGGGPWRTLLGVGF